ncbi:MAG: ribosomal-processing cysteine protease Prp [Spirochaetota bacterium]
MIRVRVVLDGEGCLSLLDVTGHASLDPAGSGVSVVCAAVTGIVRACAHAIAGRESIGATGSAHGPGELSLSVDRRLPGDSEWMRGVTDVMLEGVGRIATDAPNEVALQIERTGDQNGA